MPHKETTFHITNKTSGTPPILGVPFIDIKKSILGESHILSLVFVDDALSEELNTKYRKKKGPTNVLAFPVTDDEGEVFINIDAVMDEHRDFHRTPDKFIGYLFIHALYHLKGCGHGSKMEKEEEKTRKEFSI